MTTRLADIDLELTEEALRFYDDPLGFARWAFPWGEPGPLEHYPGPCPCQEQVLTVLGEEIRKRRFNGRDPVQPVRIAVASGHGIGKSVLAAIVDNFIKSTRPFSIGTITATSYKQLRTKTWARIQEWSKLSITGHWFETGASSSHFKGHQESWGSTPQTCAEENSEAFAGQHAARATSYYIVDEASGVPDPIWNVLDPGGLTDGEPMLLALGNPTRSVGRFYDVMHRNAGGDRWRRITIDSRTCPLTNHEELEALADEFGEDSDIVRVRVRGLPPKASDVQFIGHDLVEEARKREVAVLETDALVAGGDLAWGGEDSTTIRFRRGKDARSIPPVKISGERSREPDFLVRVFAGILDRSYDGRKVAMLFLDSAGICGPVAQRLRELGYRNVREVNFGAHSTNPKYKLMRSAMWGALKEWLPSGAIDSSQELAEDLTAPDYSMTRQTEILLEPKERIRKRIGHSTDDGDALALTFAAPVRAPAPKKPKRIVRRLGSGTGRSWMR